MDEIAANTSLYALAGEAKALILGFAVAAARMIGLLGVVPILKRAELGRVPTAIIAVGLALPVAADLRVPTLAAEGAAVALGGTGLGLALLMGKEVAIGLLLGLLFAVPFWAVGAVGDLVDHQRSIGQSGHTDPTTKSEASVLSGLLTLAMITLFVSQGGLQVMAATVYDSYAVWPLEAFAPAFTQSGLGALFDLLGRVVGFALVVAGPLVALFLISDFALAGLSRLGGRIQLSSTLPLIKNILFSVVALLYVGAMTGLLAEGLGDTRFVLDVLRDLAPPADTTVPPP